MRKDKQLPRISVITPSLNQGRYLRQCIESVLSQRYTNLELLIIDGGSTDESLSVMKEYSSAITYGVSQPDNGQSDAINKGFAKATGELVTWLNADDFYLPGALDRVAEAYAADPQAPFYFGDGLRVDEAGATLSNFFPPESVHFDRQALVMGLNYILQPSTFINRRHLEQVGYLDASLHYGMDSDMWMRLSSVGTPRAIPAALSASREYGTTKTASGSFKRVEELRQIAMKHSGLPITPGVLCYMLDTLLRFAQQEQGVFPPSYVGDVSRFWYKTQRLLQTYNAFPDGFPRTSARQIPADEPDNPFKSAIGQVETLTGWLREAQTSHAELRSAMDLRKTSHDTQIAEINRLNASAASQIETLTGWVREAREANATLQRAIDELQKAHAARTTEVHEVHAGAAGRIETLAGSLREARGARAALQSELEGQRKAHADQVAELNTLSMDAATQIETITEWVQEASRTNAAMRNEIDKEGKAYAAEVAALDAVNVSASRQVAELTGWMREARQANAALRNAMEEQKRAQAAQVAKLNGLNISALKQIETLTEWMREARVANATLLDAMEEQKKTQCEEIGALEGLLARPMFKFALGLSNLPGRLAARSRDGGGA